MAPFALDKELHPHLDAENRLVSVSGGAAASFVYDGDGRRVKATVNGVTSYYVGDHYEVSGGVVKKYYTAGGQRIAMHSGGTLSWLLNDHLGGTAHTVSGTTETGEVRYRAFGVSRFTSGVTPTTYRFTGQREEAALGLYYYNARWYDPALGRFIQPDTLVPDPADARMFDRYAYVNNNPLKFNDPSGHCAVSAVAGPSGLAIDVPCWSSGAGAALTAGAVAAVSVSAGGLYAAQWAMEDPLPSIPPLYPTLAPGEGNISVTIPIPGSTTVISGVPLIPTLDTTDPGVTPIETSGLQIVDPLPTTSSQQNITYAKGGTYVLKDPVTGEVMRTGRTSDLSRREREHSGSGLIFEVDKRTDDYDAQRGREQIIHDRYNPSLNRIRPISPNNPNRDRYLEAGRALGN